MVGAQPHLLRSMLLSPLVNKSAKLADCSVAGARSTLAMIEDDWPQNGMNELRFFVMMLHANACLDYPGLRAFASLSGVQFPIPQQAQRYSKSNAWCQMQCVATC
jgi:hypothetical protein